jgi:hypothetical protein
MDSIDEIAETLVGVGNGLCWVLLVAVAIRIAFGFFGRENV